MKRLKIFVIIGLLSVGLSGCSSAGFLDPAMSTDSQEKPLLSAHDHLNHAQNLEQDLGRLEEQVAHINTRIARYEQKPYSDPKRFRRDGLKILRGSKLKEIGTLLEKVVWHEAQASRLAALEQTSPEQPLDEKSVVKEQVPFSGSGVAGGAPVHQALNGLTTESA